MQFSTKFHGIYAEVIKQICLEFDIEIKNIGEEFGPGLIIEDIATAINESKFVIADITPGNPNVFYEVGYAHALQKPTILLAEKDTRLPFDVSGFRTIFYEDSIVRKRSIEDGLRSLNKKITPGKG